MTKTGKSPLDGGRQGRPSLRYIALAAVLAIVLAACGSDGDPGTDPGAADEPGSDDPDEDRRLVWTTNEAPRSLDINAVDDPNATALLSGSVIESLTRVQYDDDGELEWVGLLAESWDWVDDLQWRFELRDGVTFHDGSELTADDVAYSINRRLRDEMEASSLFQFLDRAEVVDELTVDVYSTQPDAFIYRAVYGIPITPEGWADDNPEEAETTAIGTGPYELASYTNGGDNAVLASWDGYWGDAPAIDEIEMRVIPEAGSALSALLADELDVVFHLTPDLLAQAPDTLTVPSIRVEMARIGTENPPFDDVRVRQALNMAVNRDALIEDLRLGFASYPQAQLVPAAAHGFDPDLEDYPYDPEGARSLLEEAGAIGTDVHLMCSTDRYGTAYRDTCSSIGQMFDEVGFETDLRMVPDSVWTEEGLFAPGNDITPPDVWVTQAGTYTLEASSTILSWLTCGSERNTYCDQELVDQVEEAAALLDMTEREAALRAVADDIRETAPFVWLSAPHQAFGIGDDVDGVMYPIAEDVYWPEWTFR